jgi:hypothetical protein
VHALSALGYRDGEIQGCRALAVAVRETRGALRQLFAKLRKRTEKIDVTIHTGVCCHFRSRVLLVGRTFVCALANCRAGQIRCSAGGGNEGQQLPKGELFWRVESFPTLDQAKAAAPDGLPRSLAKRGSSLSVRRAGQRRAE